MRNILVHRTLIVILFLSSDVWFQSIRSQTNRDMELTKIDILQSDQWDSSQVTVLGIKLGMKRQEVAQITRSKGSGLEELRGSPCRGNFCSVFGGDGWTGVDLLFDGRDSVDEITVNFYVADLSKDLAKGLIVQRLQGSTKMLATDYSDRLRRKLLGVEDERCVKPPKSSSAVQGFDSKYKYEHRGLVFIVETIGKAEVSSAKVDHIVRLALSLTRTRPAKL